MQLLLHQAFRTETLPEISPEVDKTLQWKNEVFTTEDRQLLKLTIGE